MFFKSRTMAKIGNWGCFVITYICSKQWESIDFKLSHFHLMVKRNRYIIFRKEVHHEYIMILRFNTLLYDKVLDRDDLNPTGRTVESSGRPIEVLQDVLYTRWFGPFFKMIPLWVWIPDVILFESKTICLTFELWGSLGIPRPAPSAKNFCALLPY